MAVRFWVGESISWGHVPQPQPWFRTVCCLCERGDSCVVAAGGRQAVGRGAAGVCAADRGVGGGCAGGGGGGCLALPGGRPDEVEDADVAPCVQEAVDVWVIRAG